MFCGHSLLTGLSKPCDFDKPRSRILSISLIDFTVSKGENSCDLQFLILNLTTERG